MKYKNRIETIIDLIYRAISQLKDAKDSGDWNYVVSIISDLQKQTDFLQNFIDLEED
ncbi:MAG: hypothetical protein H8E03_00515 [Pelagibacteraceae bacterium]|nr:hypothetical protein [Pelagibacteraceae bacterium]